MDFLDHPVVEVVPVDQEVSRHFAETVVELRRAGTPLPTNDIWIAASAARAGSLVLTFDRHFEAIRRVGCVILQAVVRFNGSRPSSICGTPSQTPLRVPRPPAAPTPCRARREPRPLKT